MSSGSHPSFSLSAMINFITCALHALALERFASGLTGNSTSGLIVLKRAQRGEPRRKHCHSCVTGSLLDFGAGASVGDVGLRAVGESGSGLELEETAEVTDNSSRYASPKPGTE